MRHSTFAGPAHPITHARRPARLSRVLATGSMLVLCLIAVGILAVMHGPIAIPPGDVLPILLTDAGERVPRLVIWTLRIPRFLLGVGAGAALALAGTMLQDALNNPLAEPGLLGVSSGASLIVAVVLVFDLALPFGTLPWLALLGGIMSGLVILATTHLTRDPVRMILIGAALAAFLGALITVCVVLAHPRDIQTLYTFMVGSLTGRDWDAVWLVAPWLLFGLPLTLLTGRTLNLLQLGDDVAAGLGLPVFRSRMLILLLSAAIVAAVVAVCGPISFIALVTPHMTRWLLGTPDARQVLPIAALLGATLLTSADLLARELFAPAEVPVGLFTIALGAPIALLLLRRTSGYGCT